MEKRYIEVVNSRFDTQRGIELEDGRVINVYRKDGIHAYDAYFDLTTGEIFPHGEKPEGSVCFNDLIRDKKAKEVQCYDECDYNRNKYPGEIKLTEKLYKEIQAYFKEQGYNVTIEAISYCLENWQSDFKAGYRDDANGYHLFTPCGCNPLSLRLSTLNRLCNDWQTTYFA